MRTRPKPGQWKIDLRMGIAYQLIGWALSIMPANDPEAHCIAQAFKDAMEAYAHRV